MNTKTDRASSDDPAASGKTYSATPGAASHDAPHSAPPPNPHFALFVSTVGGLGYFPKAPGTLGSLVGLVVGVLPSWIFFGLTAAMLAGNHGSSVFLNVSTWYADPFLWAQIFLVILIAGCRSLGF